MEQFEAVFGFDGRTSNYFRARAAPEVVTNAWDEPEVRDLRETVMKSLSESTKSMILWD